MKILILFSFVVVSVAVHAAGTWTAIDQKATTVDLVAVKFVTDSIGWAVGATGGVIIKSTDGGLTWKKQKTDSQLAFITGDFTDSLHGWAIQGNGLDGNGIRTTDGGTTWMPFSSGCSAVTGPQGTRAISMTNSRIGYIACYIWNWGVYKTTNGGASWVGQTTSAWNANSCISFADSVNGWAAGFNAVTMHTTDGGTWTPIQSASSTLAPYLIYFVSPQVGWLFDRATGVLFATTTAGAAWFTQTPNGASTGIYADISFISPTTGFIADPAGNIYHTTDGGATWATDQLPIDNTIALHYRNAKYAWAVGKTGQIARYSTVPVAVSENSNLPERFDVAGYYPQPATGSLYVVVRSDAPQTITLRVVDALGREQMSRSEEIVDGKETLHVDVSQMTNGSYYFEILSRSGVRHGRFIVNKE